MNQTTRTRAPLDRLPSAEPTGRPGLASRRVPHVEPALPELSLEVHEVAELARIYEPDVVAVVLRRESPVDPARVTELLARDFAFSLRGAPDALDLGLLFADAQGPSREVAAAVRDDIAYVVDVFACLLDAREVGLRVACTGRATCPEFHHDRVAIRLVSTVFGPGTEWRAAPPGSSLTTHRARPSVIVLLKGAAYPGRTSGVFHRSPPVSGRRLFYSLDALA